jgi:heptosyltransferase-2
MNLGLFLPNWVGDLVMATPALRALRRRFPAAHIFGVLRPHLADVLAGTAFLDELVVYDPHGKDPNTSAWAAVRQLRAARLDQAILFTHSLRTALVARASGARRRIGFARNLRGWLLTDRLYPRREGWHRKPSPVLDDYLELAYTAGCPPESPRIELATTAADEAAAERAFRRLGIARPLVALNCSGAFGAAKLWPSEYFGALARRVASQRPFDVLVLCGASERQLALDIVRQADHPRVVSLANEPLGLGLTKACVRRSSLLVTTDSGPRHFAAAFEVPVITLFGPTHIAWSETHYARAIHLQRQVPCGPCQRRTCPLLHHRCMRELTVDEVYAAVSKQLEGKAPCTVQAA